MRKHYRKVKEKANKGRVDAGQKWNQVTQPLLPSVNGGEFWAERMFCLTSYRDQSGGN